MSKKAEILETLEKVVGKEPAEHIVEDYIAVEKQIRAEDKSKVMYYQRRKGMQYVLAPLGVSEDDLREMHNELFPRPTKENKAQAADEAGDDKPAEPNEDSAEDTNEASASEDSDEGTSKPPSQPKKRSRRARK